MILGVIGKKRSGKDAVANYLSDTYGFINYKFAEPIKNMCKDIFGWDDEYINDSRKEEVDPKWGISPRAAQQLIGTELFRQTLPDLHDGFKAKVGSSIWVKRMLYNYEKDIAGYAKWNAGEPLYVISDVRFPNEADAIKDAKGKLLKIERELDYEVDTHDSERFIDDLPFDYKIENNLGLKELFACVDVICRKLGLQKTNNVL